MKLWVKIKDFVRVMSLRVYCSRKDETFVEACAPRENQQKYSAHMLH